MTTACDTDIPGKLAAENRRIAKKINEAVYIHILFGAFDGLSCSVSMIKYGFDLLYNDSSLSSDAMHDWMMTPAGIAVAASESVFIVAFSMLANIFDDKDKSAFKRYIALLWPYCRDTMKGLKNAYKGIRSTLQAVGMLSGQDLRYMMVPVGLVLGVLSVMNRIFLRSMRAERKALQSANAELLLEIQARCSLHWMAAIPENKEKYKNSYILVDGTLYYVTPWGAVEKVSVNDVEKLSKDLQALNKNKKETIYLSQESIQNVITLNGGHVPTELLATEAACEAFRLRSIGRQSIRLRSISLLSAAYGGVVDGLYLYMGAMGLAVLAPPVFTAMMVFSAIFAITCVATRIYEEYDYQRVLIRSQLKVELALCGAELEVLLARLQGYSILASGGQFSPKDLSIEPLKNMDAPDLQRLQLQTMSDLKFKINEFESKQELLGSQISLSYQSAALAGLKNGLAAYSAISSAMFAVAAINLMLLAPFPPAFLLACMITGMVCLIGFLAQALITNYLRQRKETPKEPEPNTKIFELLESLKLKQKEILELKPTEIKEAILDGMPLDPSPQFPIQELFEVIRSFFSGIKGQKSVDYILNPLQEPDAHGHYHDTSIMLWITAFSSMLYAVVLSLRAYARGFSQKNINDATSKASHKVADKTLPSGRESPQIPEPPTLDIEHDVSAIADLPQEASPFRSLYALFFPVTSKCVAVSPELVCQPFPTALPQTPQPMSVSI